MSTNEDYTRDEPTEPIGREMAAEEIVENRKERMQFELNGQLINFEELYFYAPYIGAWLKSITRYDQVDKYTQIVKFSDERIRVNLFTEGHQYVISVRFPKDDVPNDKGYCGCTVSTRMPRPGETWNRGNDLHDGPYTKETFDEIVRDILAYELKEVVKYE